VTRALKIYWLATHQPCFTCIVPRVLNRVVLGQALLIVSVLRESDGLQGSLHVECRDVRESIEQKIADDV